MLGEIVLLAGWQMFYFAAYAVLMGVGLVLAIQGLSLIYWFLQPKIPSKGVCVLIIVLIAVFLGSILKWVGLFEQLVRIRDRKI